VGPRVLLDDELQDPDDVAPVGDRRSDTDLPVLRQHLWSLGTNHLRVGRFIERHLLRSLDAARTRLTSDPDEAHEGVPGEVEYEKGHLLGPDASRELGGEHAGWTPREAPFPPRPGGRTS